jgi:maltose alpha-D-glucosyltransferase/alpha-amylase
MGDNVWLFDRNGVRTPMQWTSGQNAGFSAVKPEELYAPVITDVPYDPEHVNVELQRNDPNSLWHRLLRFITIRKQIRAFSSGRFEWIEIDHSGIAAYWRIDQDERIAVIHNLTPDVQEIHLDMHAYSTGRFKDLVTGKDYPHSKDSFFKIEMAAHGYLWLQAL